MQKNGLTIATANPTTSGVVVMRISGYLDGHTFVDLERHIEQLVRSGRNRLVFDLSGLGYIASAGVGLFINIQHHLKDGGSIQLVNPSPSVREIFNILGLDALFTVHDTIEAGVAAAAAAT